MTPESVRRKRVFSNRSDKQSFGNIAEPDKLRKEHMDAG